MFTTVNLTKERVTQFALEYLQRNIDGDGDLLDELYELDVRTAGGEDDSALFETASNIIADIVYDA